MPPAARTPGGENQISHDDLPCGVYEQPDSSGTLTLRLDSY